MKTHRNYRLQIPLLVCVAAVALINGGCSNGDKNELAVMLAMDALEEFRDEHVAAANFREMHSAIEFIEIGRFYKELDGTSPSWAIVFPHDFPSDFVRKWEAYKDALLEVASRQDNLSFKGGQIGEAEIAQIEATLEPLREARLSLRDTASKYDPRINYMRAQAADMKAASETLRAP